MTSDVELLRAAAAAFAEPFDGVVRVEPEGGAVFWIDGRPAPPKVSDAPPETAPPDDRGLCAWFAARDTLLRIFEEERLLTGSYVSGRLDIAGDMSVVARLKIGGADG